MKDRFNIRLLIIALCSLFGIIAFVVVMARVTSLAKPGVSVLVTPHKANVEFCGENSGSFEGSAKCKNGTMRVSAEGYDTFEQEFALKSFKSEKFEIFLKPSDGNYEHYLESKDDYLLLKDMVSEDDAEAYAFVQKTEQLRTIEDILPLDFESHQFNSVIDSTILFRENDNNCKKFFCLWVDERLVGVARSELSKYGYNIDDYEITSESL